MKKNDIKKNKYILYSKYNMPAVMTGFGMLYKDPELIEYIQSLTQQEQQTLRIAQDHLESSFNIYKSIGFLKWKENKNKQ